MTAERPEDLTVGERAHAAQPGRLKLLGELDLLTPMNTADELIQRLLEAGLTIVDSDQLDVERTDLRNLREAMTSVNDLLLAFAESIDRVSNSTGEVTAETLGLVANLRRAYGAP